MCGKYEFYWSKGVKDMLQTNDIRQTDGVITGRNLHSFVSKYITLLHVNTIRKNVYVHINMSVTL